MTKKEQTKFLDECAMRAMNSIFSSVQMDYYNYTDMSKDCYDRAEAMLKEKLKREGVKND